MLPAIWGRGGGGDCATVVENQSLRHQHVSVALGGHKKNGRLGCLAAQHVPISRVNRKFLLASLSRFPGPDTDPHQVNNNNNSKPDPGLAAPRRCPEIYQTTCLLLRGVALGGGRQREKQMLAQFLFEGATRLPAKHWPSPPHSL